MALDDHPNLFIKTLYRSGKNGQGLAKELVKKATSIEEQRSQYVQIQCKLNFTQAKVLKLLTQYKCDNGLTDPGSLVGTPLVIPWASKEVLGSNPDGGIPTILLK